MLVTLGTGIGGNVITDGQVNLNNKSGEFGHIIIRAENGRKCRCGQSGCWERYCSMSALSEDAEKAAFSNKDSILYALCAENQNKLNGELIFKAMEKGCKVANEVFDNFLDYLACGISNIYNIFAPDAIVLAGGVTVQGEKLLVPLKKKIKKDIRIEISALSGYAGAMGAAML